MAESGAFEILYREYYLRVFALCRRFLLTHECAEDAAQETFAPTNHSDTTNLSARFGIDMTIAHHHCLDKLRQAGRWEDIHAESNPDVDEWKRPNLWSLMCYCCRNPSSAKRCHRRTAGKISRAPCLSVLSSPELRRDRHLARHQPKPCGHFIASRKAAAPTLPTTTYKRKGSNQRC